MKAAVLHEYNEAPRYEEAPEPEAGDDVVLVEVAAAALHHLDLLKASGSFYIEQSLPSVVGGDGVGRLDDGRRVLFEAVPPHGSMAERSAAKADTLFDVPDDLDDATAAALANSGLGAWLALDWRAGLQPGETVLVQSRSGVTADQPEFRAVVDDAVSQLESTENVIDVESPTPSAPRAGSRRRARRR